MAGSGEVQSCADPLAVTALIAIENAQLEMQHCAYSCLEMIVRTYCIMTGELVRIYGNSRS